MKVARASLYNTSSLCTGLIAGLVLSVTGLGAKNAFANPTGASGASVNSGQVTISQNGNTETITQNTGQAIINWQNFSINNGEITRFVQPSSSSVALNRVITGNASVILGELDANGHLILVNPNGIFFGKGSTVNVSGLIASTAGISNTNFLAGNYKFNRAGKPGASIINDGTITAAQGGLIALVAPGVVNNGIIRAKAGTVVLGAGKTFTLDLYGDSLYSFAIGKSTKGAKDQNGNVLSAALANNGLISAKGGSVYLTARAAGSLVNDAINNTGIIEATASRKGHGGTIVLDGGDGTVTVAGTLNASGKHKGQKGGSITVLGKDITLTSTALLDASGATGGGTVNVGGSSQGNGPLPNADTVTTNTGSVIDVSALYNGNGGSAVIWSNSNTQAHGSIFARGGKHGGNGGSIETSGGLLNVDGSNIDASAANGLGGTWLLDPHDITINTALASLIDIGLDLGFNITIDTNAALPGGPSGPGTIEVAHSILKTSGGNDTLTLNAATDITIDSGVSIKSTHNSLGVTLDANRGGTGGNVTMNGTSSITSNGGNVTIDAVNVNLNGNNPVNAGTGNIAIDNTGTFFSNTHHVLNGATVTLNQNGGSPLSSIQNAIDAVGTHNSATLTLGTGTWNELVNVDQSNFTLTGQGTGSVIQATGNNTTAVTVDNQTGVTVSNLAVNGGGYTGVTGISVDPSSNITISGNTIDNVVTGISVSDLTGTNLISNNTINNTTADAIDVEDAAAGLTISGNHIGLLGGAFNIGANGISVQDSDGVVIKHNHIANTFSPGLNIGSGIYLNNDTNTSVERNHISDVNWDGIKVQGGSDYTIKDNNISDTTRVGIWLEDVDTASVTGNHISNMALTYTGDISGLNGDNLTIIGNHIHNTAGDGIYLNGVGGTSVVKYNHISDARLDGVYAQFVNDLTVNYNHIYDTANGINLLGIDGATIDGNSIHDTGTGINLVSGSDDQIDYNHIGDATTGISVDPSSGITISGNTIHDVTTGISVSDLTGTNLISNNTINNTTADAIDVEDAAAGLTISGNHIGLLGGAFNIGANGISVQDSDGVVIKHNHIANTFSPGLNIGSGIYLNNDTNTSVERNHISDVNWDGIKVQGGSDYTIKDNNISDTTRVGIWLEDVDTASVTGNHISNMALTYTGDISGLNGDNLTIIGNHIHNTAGDGIYLNGVGGTNVVKYNHISDARLDGVYAQFVNDLTVNYNHIYDTANGINLLGIDGATIDGNSIHDTGTGINLVSGSDDQIDYNHIGDATTGISVDPSSGITISGNTIHDVTTGISVSDLTGTNLISNNTINNTTADAIDVEDAAAGLTISGNHIGLLGGAFNIGANGISVQDSDGVVIKHNHIANTFSPGLNIGSGIYLNNDTNTSVERNHISDVNWDGIKVQGGSDYTIKDNNISDTTRVGIWLEDVDTASVTGNHISNVDLTYTGAINGVGGDDLTITGNKIFNSNGDGIYLNGVGGTTLVKDNTINKTRLDGVYAQFVSGLTVNYNHIYDTAIGIDLLDIDGAHIDGNHINQAGTGISLTDSNNDHIDHNVISHVMTGISVDPSSFITIDGNFIDHADIGIDVDGGNHDTIDGNTIKHVKTGISVAGVHTVTIDGNHITAGHHSVDGIALSHDSGFINVGSNVINDFAIGINVDHTNHVNFASNMVTGFFPGVVSVDPLTGIVTVTNGSIGVLLSHSDHATFTGDSFVSNAVGIELNGSKNTTISGVNLENDGVGLSAHDNSHGRSSSNTVVENGTDFNNDIVGVELNGLGTSFSFAGTTSFFTGEKYYFALANNVMDGLIIDASNQSFDGTLGQDFNLTQYNTAEGITLDSHTPIAGVGTVCYLGATCPTPPSGPAGPGGPGGPGGGSGPDLSGIFLLQNEESLDEPKFSYAGQTIVDAPPSFTVQGVNLSLLSPAAGGETASDINYDIVEKNSGHEKNQGSIQDLSPAAGGDNTKYASLSPSAGGAGGCGNSFLGEGFALNYSAGGCSKQ